MQMHMQMKHNLWAPVMLPMLPSVAQILGNTPCFNSRSYTQGLDAVEFWASLHQPLMPRGSLWIQRILEAFQTIPKSQNFSEAGQELPTSLLAVESLK